MNFKKEIKISNDPMSVILSANGWIKSNKGILESLDNLNFKDEMLDILNIYIKFKLKYKINKILN